MFSPRRSTGEPSRTRPQSAQIRSAVWMSVTIDACEQAADKEAAFVDRIVDRGLEMSDETGKPRAEAAPIRDFSRSWGLLKRCVREERGRKGLAQSASRGLRGAGRCGGRLGLRRRSRRDADVEVRREDCDDGRNYRAGARGRVLPEPGQEGHREADEGRDDGLGVGG